MYTQTHMNKSLEDWNNLNSTFFILLHNLFKMVEEIETLKLGFPQSWQNLILAGKIYQLILLHYSLGKIFF